MLKSNAWIKLQKSLILDPRVRLIAEHLGADNSPFRNVTSDARVTLVLGALVRLWCYADTYIRNDESVIPGTIDIVNEVVGIVGFAQLLPQDWLQVVDPTHIKFPEFHRYSSSEAAPRTKNADRQARFRARARSKKDTSSVTPALRNAVTAPLRNVTVTPSRKRYSNAGPSPLPSSPAPSVSPPYNPPLPLPLSLTLTPPNQTHVEIATGVAASVSRVFDYWQRSYGKDRSVLDGKRTRVITAALKQFDEVTLKLAIDGYKNSAHHMGENETATEYTDICLFLRDAKHIEAGLGFGKRGAIRPLTAVEQTRQHLMNQINGNGHDHRGIETESGDCVGEVAGLFR